MGTSRLAARKLDFGVIRTEFGLTQDYPADAVAEATASADSHVADRADRTDLPLVTIDPPTSMDLDQAVHVERTNTGFVFGYAIADVAVGGSSSIHGRMPTTGMPKFRY